MTKITPIRLIVIFFFTTVLFSGAQAQKSLPPSFWNNVADYTFMYFPESLKNGTDFHIQTNTHFLAFDYANLNLKDLRLIDKPLAEEKAVRQNLDFLPLKLNQDLLKISMVYKGQEYKLTKGASKPSECMLIESGKFFQRRNIINLKFEEGAPNVNTALEVVSWADRISFVLKVDSKENLEPIILNMECKFPTKYATQILKDKNAILSLDKNNNGFMYQSLATIKSNTKGVLVSNEFKSKEKQQLELIIIPVNSFDKKEVINPVTYNPIEIKAHQLNPISKVLTIDFDPIYGWHKINLANDLKDKNAIENVNIVLENKSNQPETVRLNFNKEKVNAITGISAIIRDIDNNPTGLPIQLSKNWHNEVDVEFKGPWYRGLTMLTIPAKTKIEFVYTSVNAYWGELPAASHSQLCLAGWGKSWGNNQLWEQSAIGAFGESICYEPDGGQAQTMITDQRPLMVESTDPAVKKPTKWGWTGNVGGADFFRFYNEKGVKMDIKRIKTFHKKSCPNLTEVTYAGVTPKNEGSYELTTSIYRSDDYVRGIYKIKLNVEDTLKFSRLAIVQIGSQTYSYTSDKKFAFGDENGLIEEWNTQWGGNQYKKTALKTNGNRPWISLHDNVNQKPKEWGTAACRGVIVKKWNAVIAGKVTPPEFSEFGVNIHSTKSSLVEINVPNEVKMLLPGDYIEAEIEQIILPSSYESYYGPNVLFKSALKENANSWQLVYREALGNTLKVSASVGEVLHKFPVVIKANENNEATVVIEGGIGYVPITITGIKDYKKFNINIYKNGKKINVNQEVHGKDYWQTDYNSTTRTWDITFSMPLDN
nr:fucoidanase [Flavobacterium sp.]